MAAHAQNSLWWRWNGIEPGQYVLTISFAAYTLPQVREIGNEGRLSTLSRHDFRVIVPLRFYACMGRLSAERMVML